MRLLRLGWRITVVDQGLAERRCSYGNAGSLSPGSVAPLGMPGVLSQVPQWLLDPKAPPGPATIAGVFRYQACDDRMCYVPRSVPLKWTFQVTPLDSERVPENLRRK